MRLTIYIRGLNAFTAGLWLLVAPVVYAQTATQPSANEGVVAPTADKSAPAATTTPTDEAAADSTGPENTQDNGSSEVEHNEDNYRRFMELKDRDPRTNTMPTNAFQSGSQKLDELPESSQKHLRNELREVIVEEGAWQEGDENNKYAYVPSEAAKGDRELQLQEAEAWDELVDKYQEREAQIHGNSARTQAARKAADATTSSSGGSNNEQSGKQNGGQPGSAGQNPGSQGQSGQSGQSGQAGQSGKSGQASKTASSESSAAQSKDSYAPRSSDAQQQAARDAGVSENALEFLTQAQGGNSQSRNSQSRNSQSGNSKDGNSKDGNSNEGQVAEQQAGEAEQQQTSAAQQAEKEPGDAGTSENALQFLTKAQQGSQQETTVPAEQNPEQRPEQSPAQDSEQQDLSNDQQVPESGESSESVIQPKTTESTEKDDSERSVEPTPPTTSPLASDEDEVSKAGTTQNALEALSRGTQTKAPQSPGDTLSIKDLMNAQGVVNEDLTEGSEDEDSRKQEQPDNG